MDGTVSRRSVVAPEDAGRRLDRFVAVAAGVSRQAAARLVAVGAVRVNGAVAVKGHPLAVGDVVEVPTDAGREVPIPRPDLPLIVLGEGPGWVAVDKPAGVGTHPLDRGQTGTVLNALVARRPAVVGVGEGGLRSGVVHRLDVPTSGVLLFATDAPTFAALRAAFVGRELRKTYHALVAGRPGDGGAERMHLAVTRHRPAKVSVVDAGRSDARACTLSWRCLERFDRAAWVEVDLETGHLHQVRVMMAALGHPLLGDDLYGDGRGAGRPMLHARAVRWEDRVEVHSPLPADFEQVLADLRMAQGSGASGGRQVGDF